MKQTLANEKLWREMEPLIPRAQPSAKGGRPRLDDWAAFNGVVFVLADRHRVGGAAQGAGLWQRYDVLAQAAAVADRGRLRAAAPCAAAPAAPVRPNRLDPGEHRLG